MVNNHNAVERISLEGGKPETTSVVVSLGDMQQFQQSDRSQGNTTAQHIKPMELVDLAKQPVCEDGFCPGGTRHVDVFSTANFAQGEFRLLDKDNNKYITDDEIKAYQERFKETMTPKMKGHLDSLLSNYRANMGLYNDEPFFERSGITMHDLDTMQDIEDGVGASERIKAFVDKHFDETDTNKDGKLTASELRTWEANHKFGNENPVRHRDAMNVLGHLSEGDNFARATGDYLGMVDYRREPGLTKAQAMVASELIKKGIKEYTDDFFYSK